VRLTFGFGVTAIPNRDLLPLVALAPARKFDHWRNGRVVERRGLGIFPKKKVVRRLPTEPMKKGAAFESSSMDRLVVAGRMRTRLRRSRDADLIHSLEFANEAESAGPH
jgi:hypothetical protein